MPYKLQIETELGGPLKSIPFVLNSGAVSRDSLIYGSTVKLALVTGTRQIVDVSPGRLQETFTVLGKISNTSTQAEVTRLVQMLDKAEKLVETGDTLDRVYLVEQMTDEVAARHATIYGGVVSPVDHNVVDRGMSTDHALFTITIERDAMWETGSIQTGEAFGTSILNHGGSYVLPDIFKSQGAMSRIPTVVVRTAKSGYIKKMWMGIKPNVIGFDSFDATIAVGQDNSVHIRSGDTRVVADGSANDGYKVICDFSSSSEWTTRFKLPITKWNTTTAASEENRTRYIGDYHLLMRYQCSGDPSGKFGVRAGTGWNEGAAISWGDRLYLGTTVSGDAPQWQYEDLGIISVGKGRWGKEVKERLVMESFTIRMQLTKTKGGSKFTVAFDDMVLVPADHYLYFSADVEFDKEKRAEIFTDLDGTSFGYIVQSGSEDAIGKPLLNKRKVYYAISNIAASNWGVPVEAGSVLVTVGDRDEAHTKTLASSNRVDLSAKKRTEAFTFLNV